MTATTTTHHRELLDLPSKAQGAPYSSAAVLGDLVFTSGALPIEPDGSVAEDFATQVHTALANLEASLRIAGADWSTVLKINGYVADIEALPILNEIYNDIVSRHGAPARTTVEVSRFRGATLVEFDAVAFRNQ